MEQSIINIPCENSNQQAIVPGDYSKSPIRKCCTIFYHAQYSYNYSWLYLNSSCSKRIDCNTENEMEGWNCSTSAKGDSHTNKYKTLNQLKETCMRHQTNSRWKVKGKDIFLLVDHGKIISNIKEARSKNVNWAIIQARMVHWCID